MTLFSKALPLRACTRLSAATLISSLLSLPAIASDELDSITVTANRMPTENALAPTTVITRDEIEKLQIDDLPTLLSRTPGIDMTQNGGYGKSSSIFMRGTGSGHVLVLVDGVKWQSATSGSSALQDFPVDQIERIEIVRGPRSGIYGSEAIGGVIQIFTRQGKAGKTKPYFSAGLGTKNTQKVNVGVSGGDHDTQYNLGYSYLTTNGIDAHDDNYPDHDGYHNKSLSLTVNHNITDSWSVGANLLRAEGYNEYDGGDDIYGDSVQQILGVNTDFDINNIWGMSFEVAESRDRLQTVRASEDYSHFNTRHRSVSWINNLKLSQNHQVNLGIDYDHDSVDSSSDYPVTSRDNKAVFASWQANVGKHAWLLSARHDDNEVFGHRSTGTADYGYWINDELRVSANIGTGFKAPTFNQLYYPLDSYNYEGNPDVKPEKSTSYGLGLEASPSWGTWSVNAYKNQIRDLIDWQHNVVTGTRMPTNVDKATIKGVEFALKTTIFDWQVSADASLLQPEDDETENDLRRRAKRLANIHLDRSWGDWSTGASWKLRGHSYDDADNDKRLGGYGLLDLRVAYQVDPDWTVRLTGQNMLNKDYETVEDYYSLGRTVMLSVSYQP